MSEEKKEEKQLDPVQKAFDDQFKYWSGGRPESVELDAIKIIAWDFFRQGYAHGLNEPISQSTRLTRELQQLRDRALGQNW